MRKLKIIVLSLIFAQTGFAQNSTSELNESLSVGSNSPVVSGFYNRINVGVLGGSNASPSFNIINGYRFNERWSAGLGLGTETFFNSAYIPTFIEGNYNILKKSTTPWLSVMAGYEMPIDNWGDVKGGFTCGGKVGFSYFVGKHVGISTSLGYRFAYLRDESNWWGWEDFVTISEVNRFEFRVGMVFK
ncbi:MAG: hypothetical protein GQ574_18885 [Crocinitomix sp.]|nr:hypothetical protein [Crocinitomix sp.]